MLIAFERAAVFDACTSLRHKRPVSEDQHAIRMEPSLAPRFKMVGLAALVTIGGCGSMPIGVDAPTNATLEAASAAYNEPESTEETNNDVGSRGGGGQRRPELMSSARKKGSMPDLRKINTLVSDPVAERERTAKLADEQQRRWDATARRATTSICAGC